MGLGYEVLRTVKPDIIMIALSGYGATGTGKRLRFVWSATSRAERHVVVDWLSRWRPGTSGILVTATRMGGFMARFP